jgi:hypothetical protein
MRDPEFRGFDISESRHSSQAGDSTTASTNNPAVSCICTLLGMVSSYYQSRQRKQCAMRNRYTVAKIFRLGREVEGKMGAQPLRAIGV